MTIYTVLAKTKWMGYKKGFMVHTQMNAFSGDV